MSATVEYRHRNAVHDVLKLGAKCDCVYATWVVNGKYSGRCGLPENADALAQSFADMEARGFKNGRLVGFKEGVELGTTYVGWTTQSEFDLKVSDAIMAMEKEE